MDIRPILQKLRALILGSGAARRSMPVRAPRRRVRTPRIWAAALDSRRNLPVGPAPDPETTTRSRAPFGRGPGRLPRRRVALPRIWAAALDAPSTLPF
ncbi:hypothetical protein, partial [Brevundimonas sp. A19_0]|uniref:hypothetical protein n=1 Tax=Brevundimonas sp. A19_0 TaxID=2821087 RepID=UPI001ADB3BC6